MQKEDRKIERIMQMPMFIVSLAFVLVALLYMIKLSFPLSNYKELFSSVYAGVALRTLKLSFSTVIISLLIGYPFAYFMAGLKEKGRNIMMLLVIVPFCINSLIRIYGWRILLLKFAPRFLYTDGAVLLGMVYGLLPFLILPIYNAVRNMDIRPVEAAQSLGAGKLKVFFDIIIPLTSPGIVTGCILIFIPSMGLFFLNDLLGGSKSVIAGSLIQNLINSRNTGLAAAVSVILLAVTLILIAVYNKLAARSSLQQSSVKKPGAFTGMFGKIYMLLIAIAMYLPVFVVILYSFNASHARVPLVFTGFSMEWYKKLLGSNSAYLSSLWLSLKLAFVSSFIALVIGTFAAIAMSRRLSKTKANFFDSFFSNLSNIPIMIPEVIMGLALMLILNAAGISNNFVRLVLSHITFCIPYVFMNVRTGLLDQDPLLSDAARNLGSDAKHIIREIYLPSLKGSMLSGFAIAFAMSMDDFIISFFVYGAGQGTLPMLVYSSIKTGVSPQLNALCSLIILAVFVIMLLYSFFGKEKSK